MLRLLLSVFFMLTLTTSTLYAQSVSELLDEAIQDYQFQDYDLAEEKFRSIIDQAPGNLSAHYFLGVILSQNEKYEESIEHLEYVAKAPVTVEGIDEALAQAYQGANQFDKALPLNRKRYLANPNNDAIAFQYGVNLQKTGASAEAKKIYTKLIEKNGAYAGPAHYQMGDMLYNEQAYAEAIKEFNAVDPESPYGAAAKAYSTALAPLTRPFSAYLSTEYFFNDNVNSGSRTGTVTSGKLGSQGTTIIGLVSTRQFDIVPTLKMKLAYLYYGILHSRNDGVARNAKAYDFYGHFINPEISFHPSQNMDFNLKGDIQLFNYNHQKLGDNYGATFTATRYLESKQGSANLHVAYLQKNYTNSYTSTDTSGITSTQSLAYLDADSWSYGVGATYSGKMWPASLTIDYTYNDEKTVNTSLSAVDYIKARESAFTEHVIRGDVRLPFTGSLSGVALLANASHSDKTFPNITSVRQVYTDVASTQKVYATMIVVGAKLQAMLWQEIGLTATIGYEQTQSVSNSSSLTYRSKKYFGQLSASY